uniref:Conserved oligomeric Golgi complex subunit 3 n=1 Tax=Ditylenchus dipsaci TaxID=166011 RepID=A0A915EIY2_9BILA
MGEEQAEESTSSWGHIWSDESNNKDTERILALKKCMNRLTILQEGQGKCKNSLDELESKYCSVAEKTSSLHNACDQLMSQQTQLAAANEQIKANLHHYQQYEWLMKKLQTSKLSLSGTFHTDEKEAEVYLRKYEQCLSKSLTAIKAGVLADLESCKDDVLHNTTSSAQSSSYVDDDTFALLYGVFGVKANTVRNAISQAHQFFADCLEYQTVVLELEHEYFQIREHLLRPIVNVTIQQLCQRHSNSSCTFTRDGCTFFPLDADGNMGTRSSVSSNTFMAATMSADVQYFWQQSCRSFDGFIEGLCRILYDTLRPLIIHNPHLETLAQLCSLLKVEMIEDRCGMLMSLPSGLPGGTTTGMNTPRFGDSGSGALVHRSISTEAGASEFLANPRAGFARVMGELVGDIVERIVYRTSLFAQSDVLGYTPAPGDLAYPERLVMMKDINATTTAAANHTDNIERETGKSGPSNAQTAAIDLHCLWYPTVRRTVMCLSKLYKCLDQAVFLSISRELLDACCQSLELAAQKIRTLPINPAKVSVKSAGRSLDAELFIVKHLLILREQTSPYRITSKKSGGRGSNASLSRSNSIGNVAVESGQNSAVAPQFDYSLDLSMYKSNMFQLWNSENRGRWFELSSNNALLSFLLAAPVQVSELQTDSRRIIEGHLKRYCYDLIRFVTNLLVGNELQKLSEIAHHYENTQQNPSAIENQQSQAKLTKPEQLSPKAMHDSVSLAFKNLRQNWPAVRSAFSLYIGVRETEEILLQPIRKAVVNLFTNINLHTQKYCTEEQRQVACVPNQEQIWLLLNA